MSEQAVFDEKIIVFGTDNNLLGVLTEPTKEKHTGPTLIIINSGALHRTGACRSAVTIARSLAERGYRTFRFDLYGIGDSGFGGTNSDDQLQGKPEITEAMNMLGTLDRTNGFVLHGLCSGARDAFASAICDTRVVGVSMTDGYAYRTTRFFLNKVPPFLRKPSKWINFILVRLPKQRGQAHEQEDSNKLMVYQVWPDYPEKRVVQEGFAKLISRKVRILATYTGDWKDEYNYETQFTDMYPSINFGQLLDINYMPNANHIMTNHSDRELVIDRLQNLLST